MKLVEIEPDRWINLDLVTYIGQEVRVANHTEIYFIGATDKITVRGSVSQVIAKIRHAMESGGVNETSARSDDAADSDPGTRRS